MRSLAFVLCLGACTHVGATFTCNEPAQCTETGTCEMNHFCSFPVATTVCGSGRQYDPSAGDLGGACVDPLDGNGGASMCASIVASGLALGCEDFESPLLGSSTGFNTYQMNGTLQSDNGGFYRGAYAGHAVVNALSAKGVEAAQLNHTNVALTGKQQFWMRGFYFIPTPPPAILPILAIQQSPSPYAQHTLSLGPDDSGAPVLSLSSSLVNVPDLATVPMPLGRWVCLEMGIEIATAGEIDIYIDGTQSTPLTIHGNTDVATQPSILESAIYMSPTTDIPGWDMWLDEVAYGYQRIGCDN